ncbi:MAG: TolC family protein [Cytophagales bacterium]|nr:TolC family protein [Bernardetiaceae bacterium]MDW8211028.1 TolC family protein [Cytophagales bacterium]
MRAVLSFLSCMVLFLPFVVAQGALSAGNNPEKVVLQNYTLAQCIEYALNHLQSVANAKSDVEIAKMQVGITRADGLPQINAGSTMAHNYKLTVAFVPAQFVNPNAPSGEFIALPFQPPFQGNAAITASQMLFDATWLLGLRAATVYAQLAERNLKRAKAEVVEAVTKAYYSLLIAQKRMELIEATLKRIETLYNETKAMYTNGFVEKIDVDRLEVSLNNLKTEKQRALRLIELSKAFLKFQMGLQQTDEITLGESLQSINPEALLLQAQLEDKFDYRLRPEYSVLETQRDLNLLAIKRDKLGYLPRLLATFQYGGLTGPSKGEDLFKFNRWNTFGNVGITISIPIFDGMRRYYLIQKSRLELIKTENTMLNLRRAIDLEIRQAQTNLLNAIDNLNTQRRNMELAAEVARISQIKYKEGVGSNLEVINAENDYKQAETSYYNALYEALIAKVDLDKATGKLLK